MSQACQHALRRSAHIPESFNLLHEKKTDSGSPWGKSCDFLFPQHPPRQVLSRFVTDLNKWEPLKGTLSPPYHTRLQIDSGLAQLRRSTSDFGSAGLGVGFQIGMTPSFPNQPPEKHYRETLHDKPYPSCLQGRASVSVITSGTTYLVLSAETVLSPGYAG